MIIGRVSDTASPLAGGWAQMIAEQRAGATPGDKRGTEERMECI